MKEQFINRYPITKTLKFSLIPIGKTEENFDAKLLLQEDKKRAEDYEKIKKYIDRYHKNFIESVLNNIRLDKLTEYADIYSKEKKDENDKSKMTKLEEDLRKQICKAFENDQRYKRLSPITIIREDLPEFLIDSEEKQIVESFREFTTYFNGFFENRKNMYVKDPKSTAIPYRCINENLPRFLDNVKNFKKIKDILSSENINELNDNFLGLYNIYITDVFNTDYFDFVLSQSGIDKYNSIIGGYTYDDGTKIKGLNEYINSHNQQVAKNDKSLRLPFVKPLHKQILGDSESVSFIPEKFNSDNQVLYAINDYYKLNENNFDDLAKLFSVFSSFNSQGIYISNGPAIAKISNTVFNDWSLLNSAWNKQYEMSKPFNPKNSLEKYNEKKDKAYKAIQSFSLYELENLALSLLTDSESNNSISNWLIESVAKHLDEIKNSHNETKELLTCDYESIYDKRLYKNETATDKIKTFLDNIKKLELLVKPLVCSGKEENKDEMFYSKFTPLFDAISDIDKLYDKVRNYMTQKPYSKEKIKLNFKNSQLLGGWDKNKEKDYLTVILRDNGLYYLAIMDKSHHTVFNEIPNNSEEEYYEKMEYKFIPNPTRNLPRIIFANKNIDTFSPSKSIQDISKNKTYTENINDCHALIDFYKDSISKYENWSNFVFEFSNTEQYKNINEFYDEVSDQGYMINFCQVPKSYIANLVDKGYIYLFQIYNKDFSKYSHGAKNLHTLYFEMLFDERNLSDVVYKLNGNAEMFYREASINEKEKIVHPANQPIKNKSKEKSESKFEYDIIKDKRYTKRQFFLHVPVTINFKAHGQEVINSDVQKAIKDKENNYVIGIDRGERNLLYISVVNSKGDLVEQMSLNEIVSNNGYKVDYQKILDEREIKRDQARKNWTTIESIKELKEGYISHAVHKICQLVLKYDAVIAMEDLNFGFKRGRFKVEKQVYQKFENMLISKLNLLIDKNEDPTKNGGLLRAYQLTNKYDRVNKGKQNGIIFYVPAWDTSKIDPSTGFVNLLRPKYKNLEESKTFLNMIDNIAYNDKTDMFEFQIDYDKFPKCNSSYKKKWTICTNGDRIESFRNKDKNNSWDNRRIILTDEFKKLFNEYHIDYTANLKQSILNKNESEFYRRFIKLFSLTLQMRNSIKDSTLPEDDYIVSPVANKNGEFYDSRSYGGKNNSLPCDADANRAYNIARKALWAIDKIKKTPDECLPEKKLAISNAQWLEYAQK